MELSNVGKAPKMQLPIFEKAVTTDVVGDFSLPDYQPEIKRLLRIRASVMPPTGFCTSAGVEMSGAINYFVLYTGSDNKLYCAPLITEYSVSTPMDGDLPQIDSDSLFATCENRVESTVGRVSAPRRLNIKTKLHSTVKAYADSIQQIDTDGADNNSDTIEKLEAQANCCRLATAQSQPILLSDDVILDKANAEMRVVCAEGQVFVSGVTASSEGAVCRGEMLLKITLSPDAEAEDADCRPVIMWRKLPFEEKVEMNALDKEYSATARGYCTDLSVEVEEGQLHVECAALLEILAQKNESISYVKDIYSTRRDSTEKYAKKVIHRAEKAINCNFTLSDSLLLNESGIDGTSLLADVCGTAVAESVSCDDGRCVISGKANFHLLLTSNGEYSFAEIQLPFKYEADCDAVGEVVLCDSNAEIISCRARMDGERIGIDAEIAMMLRIATKEDLSVLESISFKNDVIRRRGEYVVCFPAEGDTLWSVAKRYHAPMAMLTVANDLPTAAPDDANALDGIGYLIV